MKLTVRKIAELAGVSPAAVSLVLNDKPGVRPELRAKLTELLVQNGYTIRKKTFLLRKGFCICATKTRFEFPISATNSPRLSWKVWSGSAGSGSILSLS